MGKAQDARQNSEERGSKIKKRQWTRKEDKALIEALHELYNTGWKRDNGTFKSGYTAVLEKEMKSRLPGCNLKASPHIDSRLKTLKKHCDAITDMRGTIGIRWNDEEHTVICEDDDIWEDWVKTHSDAKGLRNKLFPYYDDLCIIFGKNRASCKGVENASAVKERECEEANNNTEPVMGADGSNGMNGANVKNAFGLRKKPDNMEANDNAENAMGANEPNEVDVSVGDLEATQVPLQGGSTSATHPSKKRSRSSDSWSSGLGEVAKMFGTFLEKYDQQFSLLVGLLGRQAAADKAAAEKRARLNGELMKIPNLSLQARLRAASLIVSDPPKTDLFFSLPDDERREWVSMLLAGLI
uniref:Myb/SANT-like domain-containing protein n=1 Tax=Davidia involucrata TaxID=16924 RepID=A0A5B7C1E6_DAVIN